MPTIWDKFNDEKLEKMELKSIVKKTLVILRNGDMPKDEIIYRAIDTLEKAEHGKGKLP